MASDPKYVRLRTGLNGRYDLNSGWGISGLDVKEMPDKEVRPRAYAFVKGELNAGRLEGASKAEFDETQVELVSPEDGLYQERAIQERAQAQHAKIMARRAGRTETDAASADEARRKAILKQQKASAKGKAVAEDDDEGDDYDAMGKAALVAAANERGLDSSGSADALRDRLRAADEDADDDEDDESEDDGDGSEDDSEGDDNGQS